MSDRRFDRPVLVRNGQFLIEEIGCLAEAFEFLEGWPKDRRGPIYKTAFRACERAHAGGVPLSVAHDAFASFARSAKILEGASAAMPCAMGAKSSRGSKST
ncbi:DUF982 domain-containing protein [Mesorhizobium sp.]|uniref:DUF982 domain-containing protein n=1 Tax=Mesorhizobium sp. TaxID=1871066 RepID=UPI001218DA65|nr:DUF982 domain-containing protein [Mesorhizobium sp.]TIO11079.1 MAG: DUF982 domain-containing protein [Mesorhizobium sp.]TIO32793.1 MAG: DUF982 domain-containing protein [Mesorhizobium sp.]